MAKPPKSRTGINPSFKKQFLRKKKGLTLEDFVEGIRNGDRSVLGRAITLLESQLTDHQELGQEIINACLPYSGGAIRIGVTGAPGVGKSTFIEAIGQYLTARDHKVAVLAIDPTSPVSKGSILGDKTRMYELSLDPKAFIRPSPAGTTLGGVAQKTREAMLLCEAAGYDVILIETVGVGQSEVAVHAMVDFFLLLLLPGAGDELQGIKRGIVEMADLLVVNKADGERETLAKKAKRAYANALHLFPPKENQWFPEVRLCSAIEKAGLEEIWKVVKHFEETTKRNGAFERKRKSQLSNWFQQSIDEGLKSYFKNDEQIKERLATIEQQVLSGKISPYLAAQQLLDLFFKNI